MSCPNRMFLSLFRLTTGVPLRRLGSLALLPVLLLAVGCSTTRARNPFASNGTKSTSDREVAQNEKSTGAESKSKGSGADSSVARRDAPTIRSGKSGTNAPSPTTQALIERELQDATPEERETLLAAFQDLPPESVQRVLRARRMGMNYASRRADSDAPGEAPSSGSLTASRDSLTDTPAGRKHSASAGLGTTDAWKDPPAPRTHTAGRNGSADLASLVQTLDSPPQVTPTTNTTASPAAGGLVPGSAWTGDAAATPASGSGTVAGTSGAAPAAGGHLGNLMPGQYQVQTVAAQQPAAGPRSVVNQAAAVTVAGSREVVQQASTEVRGAAPPDHLSKLVSSAEAETARLQPGETEADKRHYIERHVHLRMLYLITGQHERALQAIPGIDAADQEFWQQTFWGLTNYFDAVSIPASADRAAQTVSQFSNAVLRLQEKANLELRNVNFCHKIASFGNYEKYPRDEFSPGQEVLLYAEVANIHSEPYSDGRFRTSLKSTLEIYRHGPQGELIERLELPETVDLCRTHRRDYFHSYQFTIPAKLTLGPHVMKLTVEDQISKRVASYSVNFMVK